MIPPYAGCGSVAFPPTWGTLSPVVFYPLSGTAVRLSLPKPCPIIHPKLVWGDLPASAEHWRGSAIVAFSKGSHLVSHSDVTSNVTD